MITLLTKDSKRIGNAILYGMAKNQFTREQLALVETDYGNKLRLTNDELNEFFNFGYLRDYQEWRLDRIVLQEELPVVVEQSDAS